MDKEKIKKVLYFVAMFFLYVYPIYSVGYMKNVVFICSFLVSVAFVYFVKNKFVVIALTVAVTAAASIYNSEYFFTSFTMVLLIFAYRYAVKDAKEEKEPDGTVLVYSTLSIFAICVGWVYQLYKGIPFPDIPFNHGHIRSVLWIVAVPVLLFVAVLSKTIAEGHKSKDIASIRKMLGIYLFSLFFWIYYLYMVNGYTVSLEIRYLLSCPVAFLILLFIDVHPVVQTVIDRLVYASPKQIKKNKSKN